MKAALNCCQPSGGSAPLPPARGGEGQTRREGSSASEAAEPDGRRQILEGSYKYLFCSNKYARFQFLSQF